MNDAVLRILEPHGTFHPFVIPFVAGMIFVLTWCFVGIFKIFFELPAEDRKRFLLSLINPKILLKNIKDIFLDCLIHVKLWRRNKMLGFMHSSIAFGWFMLILLGHIEVFLFIPHRAHLFYYPIFYNYFVAVQNETIGGSLLMFLSDAFLLLILIGIGLAMYKRIYSRLFGMRRTSRPSLMNNIGLYALWAIFPLRLMAETFTAHICGGSFLTKPFNWLIVQIVGKNLVDFQMLPTWWAYSIALGVFMFVLPFSRYMHIPAEMLLIPMRNAGIRIRSARKGFARLEVLSCPNCGVCIDACPMTASKANVPYCTVYLTRQLRRRNEKKIEEIADKCLMCDKCSSVCQVGVEGPELRRLERESRSYALTPQYASLAAIPVTSGRIAYYAGCMTQLTPAIPRAVMSVLHKAGQEATWLDQEGGLCCGRPLFLAGRTKEAEELVRKNTELIKASGATILLVSCPICYKMFTEKYDLGDIQVVHYIDYFNSLIAAGKLDFEKSDITYVYHDPCELGRGVGKYEEPRQLLGRIAGIAEAKKNRSESVCCGGSLGSLTLDFHQRELITKNSLNNLYDSKADAIATACPLCKTTFARYADRPVRDLAEILDEVTKQK